MKTPKSLPLVSMLRMPDADLADYIREVCVTQLRAGYDEFLVLPPPKLRQPALVVPDDTVPSPTASTGSTIHAPLPSHFASDVLAILPEDLKAYRTQRLLSQETFGRQFFNCSGAKISDYERGAKAMPLTFQDRLRSLMTT
jgi:hypothetical protein